MPASSDPPNRSGKRKAGDRDGDVDMHNASEDAKRLKTDTTSSEAEQALLYARAAASRIPFLSPELLLPPKLPTHQEMEAALLMLRKKALLDEYFGDGES
jgi:pre-mRNA-splicing factor ISY1